MFSSGIKYLSKKNVGLLITCYMNMNIPSTFSLLDTVSWQHPTTCWICIHGVQVVTKLQIHSTMKDERHLFRSAPWQLGHSSPKSISSRQTAWVEEMGVIYNVVSIHESWGKNHFTRKIIHQISLTNERTSIFM